MKSALLTWQVWALLSAFFAALTTVFAKVGLDNVHPDFATFVRTVVIVIGLAALLLATGSWQSFASISGRNYVFLTLSGIGTGASWLCYFRALQLGDAGRVAPIDKLSIALVAVFSVAVLGERLSALNWLGIVLISVGAMLVAF